MGIVVILFCAFVVIVLLIICVSASSGNIKVLEVWISSPPAVPVKLRTFSILETKFPNLKIPESNTEIDLSQVDIYYTVGQEDEKERLGKLLVVTKIPNLRFAPKIYKGDILVVQDSVGLRTLVKAASDYTSDSDFIYLEGRKMIGAYGIWKDGIDYLTISIRQIKGIVKYRFDYDISQKS